MLHVLPHILCVTPICYMLLYMLYVLLHMLCVTPCYMVTPYVTYVAPYVTCVTIYVICYMCTPYVICVSHMLYVLPYVILLLHMLYVSPHMYVCYPICICYSMLYVLPHISHSYLFLFCSARCGLIHWLINWFVCLSVTGSYVAQADPEFTKKLRMTSTFWVLGLQAVFAVSCYSTQIEPSVHAC